MQGQNPYLQQNPFFQPAPQPQVGDVEGVSVNMPSLQAQTSTNARQFIDTSIPTSPLLEMAKAKKDGGEGGDKPYDPTGKTQEQIMAETGRQSELDQMGSTFNPQPMPQPQEAAPQAQAATQGLPPESIKQITNDKPLQQVLAETGKQNVLDEAGKQGVNIAAPIQPAAQPMPQTSAETPQTPETTQESVFGGDVTVTSRAGASGKGYLNSSRVNRGTDFAGPNGTPVALPQGQWEVVSARNDVPGRMPENFSEKSNFGWGNSVVVKNKETGEQMRLSHMKEGSVPKLAPGQELKGGTVIGAIGNTGNTHGKTGNHLDVEYYDSKGQRGDVLNSQYGKAFTGKPAKPKQEAPQAPQLPAQAAPQATASAQPMMSQINEQPFPQMQLGQLQQEDPFKFLQGMR